LGMESLLLGCRANENRCEQFLPKYLRTQIQLSRIHHQARPERNPLERTPLAARDLCESHAVQLALGHGLEFESVDEIHYRSNPAGWLAGRTLPAQKC